MTRHGNRLLLAKVAFALAVIAVLFGIMAYIGSERGLLDFLLPFSIAIVVGIAAACWIARHLEQRTAESIQSIAAEITKISSNNIQARVEDKDTQLQPIATSVNTLLERLQKDLEDARRFSGLAAHELKTPLTILQGRIDEAIRSEPPGSAQQQLLTDLLDQVARLKEITDRLLLLSRAEAGGLDLYVEQVNVSQLLEALAEDAELLAPDLRVSSQIMPNENIQADRNLLTMLLQNLMANAIKYNSGGLDAFIRFDLKGSSSAVKIRVANSAKPIPPDRHERIFERFHRGEKTAVTGIEGAGIGLTLARAIARAHGGDLVLEKSTDAGTVFLLILPRVAAPPPGSSSFTLPRLRL